MNRRSFLTGIAGILAASQAPLYVRSGILMPVRKVLTIDHWKSDVIARLIHDDGSCTYTYGNWRPVYK